MPDRHEYDRAVEEADVLADAGDVAGLELKKLKEELATWDADKAREKAALEMRITQQSVI